MIQRLIARILPYFPEKFVWLFSRKYIAGKTLEDALRTIRNLQEQNIRSTIDILGESITSSEQAREYQKLYTQTIENAGKLNLPPTFSLKPTMFGLLWDEEFCYTCIREILITARQYNYFLRIDMEDSQCTAKEIKLYEKLFREFPDNVGIVFQACLKRTYSDLQYVANLKTDTHYPNIRLCKGIYRETPDIAFQNKNEIRNNFILCLEYIVKSNMYAAIATHDEILINRSLEILKAQKKQNYDFEFQMLLGVTPNLRRQLVQKGFPMRVYVPFGEQWFKYSARRLQENPHMVRDILIGMFSRK